MRRAAVVTISYAIMLAAPPVTARAGSETAVIDADFTTATIAFYDRSRRHSRRIQIDDRPCDADGAPWPAAEEVLIEAFLRDRARAEDLRAWPSLRDRRQIVIAHETSQSIHEARLAAGDRRVRHRPVVEVAVHLSSHGGYLVAAGPNGVQEYCVSIATNASTVRLLPRLVDMVMY